MIYLDVNIEQILYFTHFLKIDCLSKWNKKQNRETSFQSLHFDLKKQNYELQSLFDLTNHVSGDFTIYHIVIISICI